MNDIEIGYTDASTLAQCEQKFAYRKAGVADPPNAGMTLGTLMHGFLERWWQGQVMATTPLFELDGAAIDVEILDKAEWLAARYIQQYGYEPSLSVSLVEVEMRKHIGPSTWLRGRLDRVGRDAAGDLWVIEDKTYGNRQRLDWLDVDPQPVLYKILAEHTLGEPVRGVLWNGIYTYRWKPEIPTQAALIEEARASGRMFTTKKEATEWARQAQKSHPGIERPIEESFDLRYLTPTPEQCAWAEGWVSELIARQRALLPGTPPLRNIGSHCSYCSFKQQCHEEVVYGAPLEIEVEENG
jgi:CRISPR/Cas system-associated exonuclease Cas4 (RecB family)